MDNVDIDRYLGEKDVSRMRQVMVLRKNDLTKSKRSDLPQPHRVHGHCSAKWSPEDTAC